MEVSAQVSSSSSDRGSKLRGQSQNSPRFAPKRDNIIINLNTKPNSGFLFLQVTNPALSDVIKLAEYKCCFKQIFHPPKSVLTGNLTPRGTCKPAAPYREGTPVIWPSRYGKFGIPVIPNYADALYSFT
ncbi:hypothetical protein AVEN_171122-1 [Araneus ventricosus]|uniref:Uncharacterized protein n=1 Tax=Araneus ventricosus TaxID=182803 RepID=A0A4Y2MBR8_ARAVE|nr:hypothetical protein AVEN_171122-1 [Araneus ventricosus]